MFVCVLQDVNIKLSMAKKKNANNNNVASINHNANTIHL